MLKKVFFNTYLFFKGLFFGMKGADDIISQKASYSSGDIEIDQEKHVDNIYSQLIAGKETQEVKELRDEYYRVVREANNFHVDVTGSLEEGATGDLKAKARKKTALDFTCKIEVFNPEKLPVRVIQDNKLIPKHGNFFADDLFSYGTNDFVSIFTVKRNFIPRFALENYANKVVVRTINDEYSYIDIYTTIYASQFGKVDAILISQLNDLIKTKNKKSDITDLSEFSFVTDKAYGENDLYEFSFGEIKYEGINVFDGNFVLTFKGKNIKNGFDITEKYKTKELDEKLKNKSPRNKVEGIDLFAIDRKIKKEEENFSTTKLEFSNPE